MLKKKYNLQKQLFIKHNYIKYFLSKILHTSLSRNHFLNPIQRISFFAQSVDSQNLFFKFSTLQKLHCLITLSTKVPARKYSYSRFFLNKQMKIVFQVLNFLFLEKKYFVKTKLRILKKDD